MKKSVYIFCVTSVSILSLPSINLAVAAQAKPHTIKLSRIYIPRSEFPSDSYRIISDKNGDTIIAEKELQDPKVCGLDKGIIRRACGYYYSHDKGLTWNNIKMNTFSFIPQEFSPLNNNEVLAITVQDQDTPPGRFAFSLPLISTDAGKTWDQFTNSNCRLDYLAEVKFVPGKDNEFLFMQRTGAGGGRDVYYSDDGGQSCKKTLKLTPPSSDIYPLNPYPLIVAAENNIFAIDRGTGNVYKSTSGTDWHSVLKLSQGIIALQAQDHNHPERDYIASRKTGDNVTSVNISVVERGQQNEETFHTNLKGIHYLATTGKNSRLFAIDGKNQFMFQSSSNAYDHYTPLTAKYSNEADRIDVSDWILLGVTWTNATHTEGLVHFYNYLRSSLEVTYQFEIQ